MPLPLKACAICEVSENFPESNSSPPRPLAGLVIVIEITPAMNGFACRRVSPA